MSKQKFIFYTSIGLYVLLFIGGWILVSNLFPDLRIRGVALVVLLCLSPLLFAIIFMRMKFKDLRSTTVNSTSPAVSSTLEKGKKRELLTKTAKLLKALEEKKKTEDGYSS